MIKKLRSYAGIGSQETPTLICIDMTFIATALHNRGMILRSGHAHGADRAFEAGAAERKQIFTADDAMGDLDAMMFAERFHPGWHNCSMPARLLHARNGFIMMGRDLRDPVDFVVCWTKDGRSSGGTGQALRIAEHYEIPVFNLQRSGEFDRLWNHVSNIN